MKKFILLILVLICFGCARESVSQSRKQHVTMILFLIRHSDMVLMNMMGRIVLFQHMWQSVTAF